MRTTLLTSFSGIALSMLVAGSAGSQAAAPPALTAPGMTVSTMLSPAIRIGDVLYVSGQLPNKPGSREPLDSTIQGQTKQALENVKTLVEAAGGTMQNVAKCTVFLIDVKDFAGMNSVYSTYWPKDPPARSTVVVAALVRAGAMLEIECIAHLAK